jgi:pyruvate,orthophosphate dikinase
LAIAVDMVQEGALTSAEGWALLDGINLDAVVRTSFVQPVPAALATAQVASMGVVAGAIALDPDSVKRLAAAGTPAILVRQDTVTSDIEGMALAVGILTASGGRTSHAAVVARQLGKVCLVACPGLQIDPKRRQCVIGGTRLDEGDFLSLDGNSGAVHAGHLAWVTERPEKALAVVAEWHHAHVVKAHRRSPR